jgi:DAK2 domain fusion protein YloV
MSKAKVINSIDSKLLKEMFLAGGREMAKNYEYINELNVFPVPDGDTGTNMKITLEGANKVIENIVYVDLFTLGKQYSRGLLMNARGNSGVITSQIFKGFTSLFADGQKEINIEEFINCFANAKTVSYAAVSNPVEGTILTVIRIVSEKLIENKATFKTINDVIENAIIYANDALAQTPKMLPELAEVGVVDSGGYGLCKILEGFNIAISGNSKTIVATETQKENSGKTKSFVPSFNDNNEGFGYCTEFIITLGSKVDLGQKDKESFILEDFKNQLKKMGDSLAVVVDESIVKVHIHTIVPYKVFEYAAKFGEFNKLKVENMTLQFLERNPGTTLESFSKNYKNDNFEIKNSLPVVIATVPSGKLQEIFEKEFDITHTINTSNNGNPSVQDFITQIKNAKSSNVFIIIDDGNYMLAADEAKKLLPSKIKLTIFNAKDIVRSYLMCLAFNPNETYDENAKILQKISQSYETCKVSKAVKNVSYSHISINKNDYIGIKDKKIIASGKDLIETTETLISKVLGKKTKNKKAYIIYGDSATVYDARRVSKILKEKYLITSTLIEGNQKNYFFTIAFK